MESLYSRQNLLLHTYTKKRDDKEHEITIYYLVEKTFNTLNLKRSFNEKSALMLKQFEIKIFLSI